MKKSFLAIGASVLIIAGCGSSSGSSAGSAAFCANAKALGSISKGNQDAMAMSPAESMKDFEALSSKVATLKSGAPANVAVAVDTVVARMTLEAKTEGMMAADPKSGTTETQMLADHKAADDAALATLIAGVKSACKVDIT